MMRQEGNLAAGDWDLGRQLYQLDREQRRLSEERQMVVKKFTLPFLIINVAPAHSLSFRQRKQAINNKKTVSSVLATLHPTMAHS